MPDLGVESESDKLVHDLRVKATRLEFSIKTGIHFLKRLESNLDGEDQVRNLEYIKFAIQYLESSLTTDTKQQEEPNFLHLGENDLEAGQPHVPLQTCKSMPVLSTSTSGEILITSLSNTTLPTECERCQVYVNVIKERTDAFHKMKDKYNELSTRYHSEAKQLEKVTIDKEILEKEMEELTATLFDQANRMVAEEAKLRDNVTKTNLLLSGKLEESMILFGERESELYKMRKKLGALEMKLKRHSSLKWTSLKPDSNEKVDFVKRESIEPSNEERIVTYVDSTALSEFKSFLKEANYNSSKSQLKSTPSSETINSMTPVSNTVQQSTLLKKIINDEIEPLLAYSFKALSKKKLLNCLSRHLCSISVEKTDNKDKCSVCGLRKPAVFALHLDSDTFLIDGICKEKFESIIEFYSMISTIAKKSAKVPLLELFRWFSAARCKMSALRIATMTNYDNDDATSNIIIL
ncbi:hypothetical protein ROZALSC1DRAFT_29423 [Rozella allomycis CSF55]|uniref:GDP/GTP exchange factor Sec2 N-terminal domain-containing protein n=1 Tax=Rozella allomycis (strain CSF55) TaxID=988480 RepID=A0A075AUL9_ROZAC|nr:hypothetical protein O9G_001319 [Rozella allomycis CSF55]RKP18924.1 hypothetical protein ROZALSC1DRAFT_29423 [Rozella allomycis CSF55]|eukprot:EPZ32417.1 hypothetical protein O9G_001319 [Rozella allomycis CSF55]